MILFTRSELLEATGGVFSGKNIPDQIEKINTDSRADVPESLFIAIPGDTFDGHLFFRDALKNGAVLLCCEASRTNQLPPDAPALIVDSTIRAYQNLANYHRKRFRNLKVLALTGSSGKTSTKEMLRAIFNRAFGASHVLATEGNTNNHIGVPQNLLRLTEEHRIAILEMGTNHHGEIECLARTAEPDAAMIVSIGRCHLENLGSLEGVAKEKSHIFKFLPPNGCAVIPSDAVGQEIMLDAVGNRPVTRFGHNKARVEAHYQGGDIQGSTFTLTDHQTGETVSVHWSLSGAHQAENASGAAALALASGIPLNIIAEGLTACVLPGMRMKITEHDGARWINDAYNANPDSMRATLAWLKDFAIPEKLVLVLGDMREIGSDTVAVHEELLRFAQEKFPEARLCAVGENMTIAAERLNKKNMIVFPDSQHAAGNLPVHPGDLVFLKASRGTRLELVEPK